MTAKEIVKEAIKSRGITQTILAQQANLKRVSNVSEMLRSTGMSVNNFVRLLNAMGFEVVVKDRNLNNKTNWKVTLTSETFDLDALLGED